MEKLERRREERAEERAERVAVANRTYRGRGFREGRRVWLRVGGKKLNEEVERVEAKILYFSLPGGKERRERGGGAASQQEE